MVKLLVENGASLLKPKTDGITILHVATCSTEIIIHQEIFCDKNYFKSNN